MLLRVMIIVVFLLVYISMSVLLFVYIRAYIYDLIPNLVFFVFLHISLFDPSENKTSFKYWERETETKEERERGREGGGKKEGRWKRES